MSHTHTHTWTVTESRCEKLHSETRQAGFCTDCGQIPDCPNTLSFTKHHEVQSLFPSPTYRPVAPVEESYWVSVCFSENTRMQKSPLRCGSKVDGTIRYSPGGSLKREQTSRRLMKVSDRAVWAWARKKFLSRCTSLWPWNWGGKTGQLLFQQGGRWCSQQASSLHPEVKCWLTEVSF